MQRVGEKSKLCKILEASCSASSVQQTLLRTTLPSPSKTLSMADRSCSVPENPLLRYPDIHVAIMIAPDTIPSHPNPST